MDDKVNNEVIYIPLEDSKNVTGNEINDDIILKISKRINELSTNRNVQVKGSSWYSKVILYICEVLKTNVYNEDQNDEYIVYANKVLKRNL